MNYGKIIDGILHIYAAPGEGRKPIRDSIPEGYGKEQCIVVEGSHKEFEDCISMEYVYIEPGRTLTEQRIESLETAQATADAALQDLIVATMGGDA